MQRSRQEQSRRWARQRLVNVSRPLVGGEGVCNRFRLGDSW